MQNEEGQRNESIEELSEEDIGTSDMINKVVDIAER